MLDVIGVGWPNVDEDAYRDMADALREFAEDADEDAGAAYGHVQKLLSSGRSESLSALDEHWSKVQGKHKDLAKAARVVAGALDRVADIIVARKALAVAELAELCATVGISLAFAPVTAGLSTLLAGAKIAATRIAFKRILKEMADAAVAEIVATFTEPAVAAIENIVADLAIQTAMNVAGVQNGYDAGQTAQACKEGLQLNSAGGASVPGPRSGPEIDHDAHRKAGTHLAGVQVNMRDVSRGKLGKAKTHHGRAKGKDSLTAALDTTIEGVTEKLTKALDDLGDHIGKKVPSALTSSSKTHKDTDGDIRDQIRKVHAKDGGETDGLGDRTGSSRPGRGQSGSQGRKSRPDRLDTAKDDPQRHGVPLGKKTCKNDPVDVATGEMTLSHTDLSLPGSVPFVLRRTHLSEYRWGHWFGRSWASTLDERIELDSVSGGAIWAREDGSVLIYPRLPAADDSNGVLPLEGPRLALTFAGRDNGSITYRVDDPLSGITRYFTGSPYSQSPAYWLNELEDRNQVGITFVRRGDGAPVRVVHDGGYEAVLRVDDDRVTELSLQTPEGLVTVVRYGYDESDNLTGVTNSSGLPLRLAYDAAGRVTAWTDRNGSTFQYVYDEMGRVVRTIGPDGFLSSRFSYEGPLPAGGRITRYTDSAGSTTVFEIDQRLQLVAETDPLGNTVRFTFDAQDRLLSQTDALGHTVRFERDLEGNLVGLVAPDRVRTGAAYNAMRLPIEVTERGGAVIRFEYDDRGNRTAAVDPAGARTEYEFNDRGHVTGVRNALGELTRLENDKAGLPVRVTASDGAVLRCERDAFGRIIAVTDAIGGTLRQGWTIEGKPAWRELPDGTREEWSWDGEGNLTRHMDRMGRVNSYTATHFDLPASSVVADGGTYSFRHDTELRLTAVVNAQGLEWHYRYDAAGRLVSETDFDGRTVSYEHDAAGRLVKRTNGAGQGITFDRDVLGRVVRMRHDDGATSVFGYDESGHVGDITNDHAHIQLMRDKAGRVVAESVNGRTTGFAYDVLGRRIHRRTPSGATSDLAYGPQGLASYATGEHTFRFERDLLGREISRTLNEHLVLLHGFDSVGRVTNQSLSLRDTSLMQREFTYRPDGAPVSINDSATGLRTYTVDAASRITAVQAAGWTEQYAYNTAGDQTSAAMPQRAPGQDSAGDRRYDGTQLTQAGRTAFAYDGQGRVIRRTLTTLSGKTLAWHFTWDAEDRLTRVRTPGHDTWDYRYDALGRRVTKQHTDRSGHLLQTITYSWDGSQLAEEDTHGTTLIWDYTGLKPLAQREVKRDSSQQEIDRRFFAIVTDLSGAPSELVDEDGSLAWRSRRTAWGATQWSRSSTALTPLRYPGQYFDPETGLHYNVNRYYDPGLGRYLSPDPLGLAPAINHYAYVPNPFTLADPLGLAGCEADPTWGGRVTFTRDQHGRPFEMNATITRDMLDEGTHASQSLRPPGFMGGDENQARGHLLARMLGGSGDTLDNLFTITQNPTNSPVMRDLEQAIYDEVNSPTGGVATYNVYLEYTDDRKDSVPKYIQLEAFDKNDNPIKKSDGTPVETILTNPAHAQQQQQRRRQGIL
ncbi:RHS repeat-associated core domain-containing protein [Streptomyces sp. NPDC047974]|uniref:RHS repeat-associated core domain-containing protein n=1 Tax=Streptomyces sp. NPDC047974 TaxID=3154343 RepID=UPI0033F2F287